MTNLGSSRRTGARSVDVRCHVPRGHGSGSRYLIPWDDLLGVRLNFMPLGGLLGCPVENRETFEWLEVLRVCGHHS